MSFKKLTSVIERKSDESDLFARNDVWIECSCLAVVPCLRTAATDNVSFVSPCDRLIHCESKKHATILSSVTLPNVD